MTEVSQNGHALPIRLTLELRKLSGVKKFYSGIMDMRDLSIEDETTVKDWLGDYLTQHIDWWSEAYGVAPQTKLETLIKEEWAELLEAVSKEETFVNVAGDKPAGIVYVRTRHDKYLGVEIGVLAWIYVSPEARGQNVSAQLLDAASVWMKTRAVGGREVYVTAQNGSAVRLYERHDYSVVDHRMLAKG